MVDRQDIDALLIGSLYGELSSTEEARLVAHLESHPADRTALANLTHARDVVRESRILQVQFEPKQSISALLMQEAARRAPKPHDEASWFQRFMRSFMTHPAMAAAAMLVLIVGVAGTVYMRQGDHFAKQTADDSVERSGLASTPTTQAPAATPAPDPSNGGLQGDSWAAGSAGSAAATGASTDDYRVGLDDQGKQLEDKVITGSDAPARPAEVADAKKNKKSGETLAFETERARRDQNQNVAKESGNRETLDRTETASVQQPTAPKTPAAKTTAKVAKPSPRLEVSTPGQAPKDFDNVATKRGLEEKKPDTSVAAGAGTSSAPRKPTVEPKPADAAPPPPPPPAMVATGDKEKQEKADPMLAWAKERHGKVVAAVRAGNCQNAANIAVEISNRAPGYYASNVETDRTIKPCMQYITAQREKEVERTQRAKATQRRSADEAPAPTKSK